MGNVKDPCKFVYDVVLIFIESSVCVDDLPDLLNDAIFLLAIVAVVDNLSKMPYVYTSPELLFGHLHELVDTLFVEAELVP